MRRNVRLIGLMAVLAVTLAACRQEESPVISEPPGAEQSPTPATSPRTMKVQMAAQSNSGQNGTATVSETADGQTRVVIELTGGPAGPQPAHIHPGSCANLNPQPKYGLNDVVNGKSETTVPVKLDELIAGKFAINVHKSSEEVSVYFSCGNIVAG